MEYLFAEGIAKAISVWIEQHVDKCPLVYIYTVSMLKVQEGHDYEWNEPGD